MRPRVFAAAACALALSACLGGGHVPDHLLTLTSAETRPVAAAAQRRPERGGHRRRADRAAGAPHDPHPGLRQRDRGPVSEGRGLGGESRPLFGRLLGETIAARTGRVVLDPSQYSHDPGTRLTGQLLRFGLDPAAMEVVVTYDAAMARGASGGVTTNRFEARVPVAAATPEAVAPALNQAANQVADPGRGLARALAARRQPPDRIGAVGGGGREQAAVAGEGQRHNILAMLQGGLRRAVANPPQPHRRPLAPPPVSWCQKVPIALRARPPLASQRPSGLNATA